MLSKVTILCGFLLVFTGCGSNSTRMPEIVHNPTSEPESVRPEAVKPRSRLTSVQSNVPKDWLPPSRIEKKWTVVVIHHSATETGNAAIFDRMHREENHWDGVGYDFVIGNGADSGDGQIEVTFRWQEQVAGAHCGGTPDNWANLEAVGICLVGNFNHTTPTAKQMRSLVKLTRFLQKRYRIPTSRIYGHSSTPGARVTDCPGKMFPVVKLREMLGS
ncbi:MAG: peptidoglycan recognition family protein [Planctomycetota bacterium]|nr:peptidoglycan recognition family protein [Planctomycetota bacterium]